MNYIIYQTTNVVNGKIYVGAHKCENLNDGYLGSGLLLGKAIEKYGREHFNRKILHFCESETDMYVLESKIVNVAFINRKDTYNLKEGGIGGAGPRTNETKAKISNSLKLTLKIIERNVSEETRNKISNTLKGNIPWNKGKEVGNGWLGKMHTEDTKSAMATSAKNRPKVQCPHCMKFVDKSTSKRWHFDNCKKGG